MSDASPAADGISVVIPFYNAERYFAETLASVLAQTHPASEIIVVNDSPSDASRAFLAGFADRCTVVTMPANGGVSAARNTGVRKAAGPWVAFLDADDLWEPTKLARQLDHLHSHPEQAGCHTGVRVFSQAKTVAVHTHKPAVLSRDDLVVRSQVSPSSFMIRKTAFEAVGGFDEGIRSSEDYDLSIRLVLHGFLIGFLSEPLIGLRREQHGNLSSLSDRVLQGHLHLLRKHWQFYYGHGGFNGARAFLGKALLDYGYRRQGLVGRLYVVAGRLAALGCARKD